MTRQRLRQKALVARGLCMICAAPRNLYAYECDHHAKLNRLRKRRATGSKPKRRGKVGRPILKES